LGAAALCVAATAAAAGYDWLSEGAEAPTPSVRAAPPEPQVVSAWRAPASPPPASPSAVVVEPPPVERNVARAAKAPSAGEDPAQVMEAVRALRKQGDPKRAQALLDRYLARHPRGALAEDALALSIEAALAQGDARAADHARRYLSRFPNGRFRALAERALAR
jgi:hypothetical protein